VLERCFINRAHETSRYSKTNNSLLTVIAKKYSKVCYDPGKHKNYGLKIGVSLNMCHFIGFSVSQSKGVTAKVCHTIWNFALRKSQYLWYLIFATTAAFQFSEEICYPYSSFQKLVVVVQSVAISRTENAVFLAFLCLKVLAKSLDLQCALADQCYHCSQHNPVGFSGAVNLGEAGCTYVAVLDWGLWIPSCAGLLAAGD